MAKRKTKDEGGTATMEAPVTPSGRRRRNRADDTPDLIPDFRPENEKKILAAIKKWEAAKSARTDAANVVSERHDAVIEELMQAGIQPNADGSFKFKIDDLLVEVPAPTREFKIKRVKPEPDSNGNGEKSED